MGLKIVLVAIMMVGLVLCSGNEIKNSGKVAKQGEICPQEWFSMDMFCDSDAQCHQQAGAVCKCIKHQCCCHHK